MKGGSRDTSSMIDETVVSNFKKKSSRRSVENAEKVAEEAVKELKQNAKKEVEIKNQVPQSHEHDEDTHHSEDITEKHQEVMKNEVLMTSQMQHSHKQRKFANLERVFSDHKYSLQNVRDEQVKWGCAIELVLEIHHSCAERGHWSFFHHVRKDKNYGHLNTGKTDIKTLLHAIQSVSTTKGELSTQIHPQELIHLFKELLEQLKFELQFRSTHHSNTQITKLIAADMEYLQNFRYILEWFGEKLLACMIHLSLTINSAHNHKLNADFVEQQLLHGIDRLIAIPVALSVGVVAPVKVERKVSKILDSISDKLIQGKLDRHLLRFITIIEQLYQNLIHSFESSPLFNQQVAMEQQLSMNKYRRKSPSTLPYLSPPLIRAY